MNIDAVVLMQEIDICRVHSDRLTQALCEMEKLLPLTVKKMQKMSTHELAITELLTGRFSKLQDSIAEKIFPLVLASLGENIDNKSFIDRLNLLEKLEYIDSAEIWFTYRRARNAVTHEYPDAPNVMVKNLEEIILLAKTLVEYWKILEKKIKKYILSGGERGI